MNFIIKSQAERYAGWLLFGWMVCWVTCLWLNGLLGVQTLAEQYSRQFNSSWMVLWVIRLYSAAQLQGNVCTRFRHVSHAFWTHPCLAKRGVALMYVLLQLYREVLRLHGRVLRASQTRPARISDAFGCYLGAELYCSWTFFWVTWL